MRKNMTMMQNWGKEKVDRMTKRVKERGIGENTEIRITKAKKQRDPKMKGRGIGER